VAAAAVFAGVVLVRLGGGGVFHRDFHGIFGTVSVSLRADAVYRAVCRLDRDGTMEGLTCV
jgi:hypothetical protein